ncbi:hypothetical protein [Porphyrobacter sp. AAP60]|uniref:hypothetical protein n=1 Tax=Porphyrobacter sp. AAP60 TaxID=1523423 RepID=UPI0006B895E2|nr:hypothetical protein [Porphyrobacter sp. AAP60]KPF63742.1 hypothetical protein IP79_07710 [Porphyrobacter sp. AAP60]
MADPPLSEVPVLILGESHSTAISRAIDATHDDSLVSIDVRIGSDASKINFDLFKLYNPNKLVLAFGGTEHNIIGMIEGEPKFDFLWPPFEDFDTERTLVPAAVIEEVLRWRMQSGVIRALRVREHFDCPAYVLAPPPPFLEIDGKTILPKAFSELFEAGIAPAPIRRKLYAMQCTLMKSIYKEHGIAFITAPPKTRDKDGFLHRKFWGRDPTHGNQHYGRILIQHLNDALELDAKSPGKKANV